MYNFVLNYRVYGSGSPLLMVHGFGVSFKIWERLLPFLRPYFTLIMIELPGIGRSPESTLGQSYLDSSVSGLERLRNLLGIERWNILSYSSGTRIAEKYIQLYSTHVERAAFLCPAQVSHLKSFGLYIAIQLDQYLPQFGDWILSGSRLKFLIDLLGFNLKKDILSSSWLLEIGSQPLRILKETLRSLSSSCGRPFRIPNDVPALFVWGDEDLIVDTPRMQARQDRMIHATHSAPQTAVQKVVEVVLPFLLSADGNS